MEKGGVRVASLPWRRGKKWEREVGSSSAWRNEEGRGGPVRLSTAWRRGPAVDTLPRTVEAGGEGRRRVGEGSIHVAHSWAGQRESGLGKKKKNRPSPMNSAISY
jgi:hypothetical protein